MHKDMSCTAATGDFYTFSCEGTFSSPEMESGKFTLQGDRIVQLPVEEVTGKVRKEALTLQRSCARLTLDGTPSRSAPSTLAASTTTCRCRSAIPARR
jgi:hypothetical protein